MLNEDLIDTQEEK